MKPLLVAILIAGTLTGAYAVGFLCGKDDRQRCEPQVVVGPPGQRGQDGIDGQDCDCEALKQEGMAIVAGLEQRIGTLESQSDVIRTLISEGLKKERQYSIEDRDRITRHIEANQCKCKCR